MRSFVSSSHPPAAHCFLAPGFFSPLVTLSPVALPVRASAPSCCFCPASRKHDSFTCPGRTHSACPGQGDFSHLALVSAYSQYLHNILSMWGNLKRFGSMTFGEPPEKLGCLCKPNPNNLILELMGWKSCENRLSHSTRFLVIFASAVGMGVLMKITYCTILTLLFRDSGQGGKKVMQTFLILTKVSISLN